MIMRGSISTDVPDLSDEMRKEKSDQKQPCNDSVGITSHSNSICPRRGVIRRFPMSYQQFHNYLDYCKHAHTLENQFNGLEQRWEERDELRSELHERTSTLTQRKTEFHDMCEELCRIWKQSKSDNEKNEKDMSILRLLRRHCHLEEKVRNAQEASERMKVRVDEARDVMNRLEMEVNVHSHWARVLNRTRQASPNDSTSEMEEKNRSYRKSIRWADEGSEGRGLKEAVSTASESLSSDKRPFPIRQILSHLHHGFDPSYLGPFFEPPLFHKDGVYLSEDATSKLIEGEANCQSFQVLIHGLQEDTDLMDDIASYEEDLALVDQELMEFDEKIIFLAEVRSILHDDHVERTTKDAELVRWLKHDVLRQPCYLSAKEAMNAWESNFHKAALTPAKQSEMAKLKTLNKITTRIQRLNRRLLEVSKRIPPKYRIPPELQSMSI